MDPAVNQNQTQISPASSVHKEQEPVTTTESIEHITTEIEIPKELEKAGVIKYSETIELPPDVKKLGVTPSGPSSQVTTTTTALPQVKLPISDSQVIVGLHMQILSALRWLSVWCIKKLKKAHVALKVIHGKVMRVKN